MHYVSEAMRRTGVSFALDVHGEEMLPYCFLAGAGGTPSFDERRQTLEDAFISRYMAENSAMQTEHGYPVPAHGEADLTVQTYWAAEEFGCVALTLEMPFCDDANHPDPVSGWSPERAAQLGADAVPAIDEIFDAL